MKTLLITIGFVLMNTPSASRADVLWYQQPAARWLEALPVGNGRVGAMVFGGVAEERLALNEITFWSGQPTGANDNPKAPATFAQIRALFRAQQFKQSKLLIPNMLGRKLNYGTNLPAGDLFIVQDGVGEKTTDYRRELDLNDAVARVSFTSNGVRYTREIFASHPAGVLVLRLTADHPNSIGFTLRYQGGSFPWTAYAAAADTLEIAGRAVEKNHSDGTCGVALSSIIRVIPEGGTVIGSSDKLQVKAANSAMVLIAVHTDFHKSDPKAKSANDIAAAQRATWQQLLEQHLADYQPLYRRVVFQLDAPANENIPTDKRRAALSSRAADPALAQLFFNYGRYLTIAGSRADSPLPMHLQGLWNDSLAARMEWTCDFHLDINTQQNYWPAEVCNLSECTTPLLNLIRSLPDSGHRTAKNSYNIDHGWVCHVFTNPWGFTAPGWGEWWGLHVTGGAWISTHLWEHYQFTQDKTFLAEQAYPVLKGAAEFFLEYLYEDPRTGYLLTGPSVSPELGGETTPGCTHDREVIFELFTECIDSSRILGMDTALRAKLLAARAKLPPLKIGRNGQLQEWSLVDDGGQTNHRHTSHLVGLFPFAQITPLTTPDLAAAAATSLKLRMDRPDWEDVEWSAANAVCYCARLGQGDPAYRNLINLLASDTDSNLLCYSRGGIAGAPQNIAVIDGNTAGTAGIAELLLQSDNGELSLLPALPTAWPTGKITGLRARGGFTVDITWKDRKVVSYRVSSPISKDVSIRVDGVLKRIRSQPQ